MPLWDFHSTKGLFTADEKQQLVKGLTPIYVNAGLPPFYVQIRFTEHEKENMYTGGEPSENTVIIRVEHLARHFVDFEAKKGFMAKADKVLNPIFKPKGLFWEYAITLVDRDTWSINGMSPPLPHTKAERIWFEQNWPVEFDAADNQKN